MAGFTHFDEIPQETKPTTKEMVSALSSEQRTNILEGYARNLSEVKVYKRAQVKLDVVLHLYKKIDQIKARARALMRGEVIVTGAVRDPETNEVTTPATYNIPPTTSNQLRDAIVSDFAEDFNATQIGAILTKMVKHSKSDRTGTWAYYAAGIIK